MAKKIMLSDGHGIATPGKRTPDGYNENRFNKAVVNFLEPELERCGFVVKQAAPTDSDTPLKDRTDAANEWGADAYLAVHFNALFDKWRDGEGGIETYHYPGSEKGKKLATCIHKQLMKGTKMKDRGVKGGNLHEVREPNAPAALIEAGFMDIKREADLMKSAEYQKECAVEIAKGTCDYFDVEYKPEEYTGPVKNPPTNKPAGTNKTMYRVVTGSFSDRENAEQRVKELKAKGFDSFLDAYQK